MIPVSKNRRNSPSLLILGAVNKFLEPGNFLYNSKFLLSFLCSTCIYLHQLNDNSHSVSSYFLSSYFLLEDLYPLAKIGSQKPICSSLELLIVPKSRSKQVACQISGQTIITWGQVWTKLFMDGIINFQNSFN